MWCCSSWGVVLVATFGVFSTTTNAQIETLQDLGSVLSNQPNLTTFYNKIKEYPSILMKLPTFGGVTILAPNNAAFDKIPYTQLKAAFENNDNETIQNVLEYHMLQGTRLAAQLIPGSPVFIPTFLTSSNWTTVTGGQRVENIKQAGDVVVFVSGEGNRCTLLKPADLMFTGGVIQIIDNLIIPPSNITATSYNYGLTSFEGALYASKKIDEVIATPNLTMFAPSNSGFQALGPAISSMTAQELATVMDYHTLTGLTYSDRLTNGTILATKQGENITIRQYGNNIYINSAQLLQTDILISNGVLHIIDNVLNPQGPDQPPHPHLNSQVPIYASALFVNDPPFTSNLPCTVSCPVTTTSSVTTTRSVTAKKTFSANRSKAQAAAMARETGFGAAGLVAAIGGVAILI